MAKLIYSAIASLDGYVEDESGSFDWAAPDEEVHAFVNDLERPIGTYLYGRRMYETMVYWETVEHRRRSAGGEPGLRRDLAGGREGRVLPDAADGVQREDPDRARASTPMRSAGSRQTSTADITIGGAELAGQALAAGLVDECHLFLGPIVVGGGKRALPDGAPRAARTPRRAPLRERRRSSLGTASRPDRGLGLRRSGRPEDDHRDRARGLPLVGGVAIVVAVVDDLPQTVVVGIRRFDHHGRRLLALARDLDLDLRIGAEVVKPRRRRSSPPLEATTR